jgi:16S rRNA (adenine1518-N6/adenine1519-N6)-dimethyltransferase
LTLTRSDVSRLLEAHGLSPSRALGQNFVADPNTVRKIVRLAMVQPGDLVVEVGGGLGSLTLALLEAGARVTVVEKDRWLVPVLGEVLSERAPGAPVRVVQADAMVLDWSALLEGGPWSLVANLPYNVATPLVADLLDRVPAVVAMTVMVQKEAADRLVAGPGSPAYGAVSVKVAYWAEARLLASVPSSVFVPRPRVASAVVGIRRRAVPALSPAVAGPEELFRVVRAGFAQRRKMLRRSLAVLGAGPSCFEAAGVGPSARPEELSLSQWGALAAALRDAAVAPEAGR